MSLAIELIEKQLDQLFDEVKELDEGIIKSHMTRYLCVRTSGYIESLYKSLIGDFTDGTSPKQIQRFVEKKTKYSTNLVYARMIENLTLFSVDWSGSFEQEMNTSYRESLNSVISLRNNIAHGGSNNLSYNNMQAHYTNIKGVAAILKKIIIK